MKERKKITRLDFRPCHKNSIFLKFIFSWAHPFKIVSLKFVTAANLVSGISRALAKLCDLGYVGSLSSGSQFPLT